MSTQPPGRTPEGGVSPFVLVVDDDDGIADVVSRFLRDHGLRTAHARDARATRDSLERMSPDLVLLDLGLPDEDGLGLLRHLEQRGGPPAIVVSGRGATCERVIGLELGAHDYIAKPFDLHELLALMAPRPFLVSGGAEDTPRRWQALNHVVAVNRLLGAEDRVAMTNRPEHAPNPESNEQIDQFLVYVLKPPGARADATDRPEGRY